MANVEKLASTQTIGRHCQGESGAIPYIHFTPQLYQTAQRRGTLLYIDLIPSSIVQGQYGTLDDVLKHSAYQYTPQAITSNPFRLNVKLPQITIQNNRWRLLLRLHAGADLLAYAASTSFELSSTSVAPQIMQVCIHTIDDIMSVLIEFCRRGLVFRSNELKDLGRDTRGNY